MRILSLVVILAGCAGDGESESIVAQGVITERNALVAAGASHSCAIEGGAVRCWGRNQYGQLGDGTTTDSATPVTVVGIKGAEMVTAGDRHACAVLVDGTARCWGNGTSGQLGNGGVANQLVPVVVASLADVSSISAGGSHTCASLRDGSARCWGSNVYGQLGNGQTTNATTPQVVRSAATRVSTLADVTEIEVGKASSCARLGTGSVRCWGRNQYGQLGDGTTTQRTIPVTVANVSNAGDLAVGDYHACAVVPTGRARCWGFNLMGQLGDGTQSTRTTAVEVRRRVSSTLTYPIVNVSAVTAGAYHTCLRSAGDLWCMGRNDDGQLARDLTPYVETLAVSAIPELAVDQIAAGAEHTCIRRPTGAVVCFGADDYGQVGDRDICPATPTIAILDVTTTSWSQWPVAMPHAVLERGNVRYTNGDSIDIRVEASACTQVSSVDFRRARIEPGTSLPDGSSYEVLSTIDRDDGMREHTVRVSFDNRHDGFSYAVGVSVTGRDGGLAQRATFLLAEVSQINSDSGSLHFSADELMNEAMAGLYEKFGDSNYWDRGDAMGLYDFDYANFAFELTPSGIYFTARLKADLYDGHDNGWCDPTAYVDGEFRIMLDGDAVETEWVDGPNIHTDFPTGCELVTLDLAQWVGAVITQAVSERKIARKVRERIAELAGYCPLSCGDLVDEIVHTNGAVRVDLQRILGSPTVSYNVPYSSAAIHSPSDLEGILIPVDTGVLAVTSGVVEACGLSSGECDLHSFGADGLFNWSWTPMPLIPDDEPHIPIPDPWPCTDTGACAYHEGRHGPWLRLVGLNRALADLRMPNQNPGSVIGKVITDGQHSDFGSFGSPCGIDRRFGATTSRLVIGRNDVATGGPFGSGTTKVTLTFDNIAELAANCVPEPAPEPEGPTENAPP